MKLFHTSDRSAIEAAKEAFTIGTLWRHYGLRGKPGASCCCPFHDNTNTPAFSVFAEGMAFKCHAGCGQGDAINFIALAEQIDPRSATKRLLELHQGAPFVTPATPATSASKASERRPEFSGSLGSPEDLQRLHSLRGIPLEGIALALERGLLRFGDHQGCRCWFACDGPRRNIQARRLDGLAFSKNGQDLKALSLPGSKASHPIGITESLSYPNILMVEGGPDILAAAALICLGARQQDSSVVGILGVGHRIPNELLHQFETKRVRIFAHNDTAGLQAATRWKCQLQKVGTKVDTVALQRLCLPDGKPAKDLNDLFLSNQTRPNTLIKDLLP